MTKDIRFRNMEKTILHQAFKFACCNKANILFQIARFHFTEI